jgi:hypothetical protein
VPVFVFSSDGGSTWNNATPPPKFTAVSALSCPPSGACVAVGSVTQGASSVPTTASLSPTGQWSTASTPVTQAAAN